MLRVCSATVRLKCVLLIQGQSIAEAQRRPWPQTMPRPRPTTNVMTTGSSSSSSNTTNSKTLGCLCACVCVCLFHCPVCPAHPACPARCPSAQSRTCTAPNQGCGKAGGCKSKSASTKTYKNQFYFISLYYPIFFGQLTCLFSTVCVCVGCVCVANVVIFSPDIVPIVYNDSSLARLTRLIATAMNLANTQPVNGILKRDSQFNRISLGIPNLIYNALQRL